MSALLIIVIIALFLSDFLFNEFKVCKAIGNLVHVIFGKFGKKS